MERQVDMLPQAEHGELQGCCGHQTDTAHWRVPSSLHPGALTRLGGGPDTLPGPGPHRVRRPQRRHLRSPEPTHSASCWSYDGVRAGGPPPSLLAALAILPHEDMVADAKGYIVVDEIQFLLGTYWRRF